MVHANDTMRSKVFELTKSVLDEVEEKHQLTHFQITELKEKIEHWNNQNKVHFFLYFYKIFLIIATNFFLILSSFSFFICNDILLKELRTDLQTLVNEVSVVLELNITCFFFFHLI